MVLAVGRLRQDYHKFKASLGFLANARPTRHMQQDLTLKNKTNKTKFGIVMLFDKRSKMQYI